MRRILRNTGIVIMIIVLCVNFALTAAAEYEKWYVGASSGLNLREKPTTDSGIITVYPKGTELSVIDADDTGEWWEVCDGFRQGWVCKKYLTSREGNDAFTYHGHSDTPLCAVTITQYDTSPAENGGYTTTARGDKLTDVVGLAISADLSLLPMDSKVYIDGIGYRTVRDVGGAIKGHHIDLLVWNIDYSWDVNQWHNVYVAW